MYEIKLVPYKIPQFVTTSKAVVLLASTAIGRWAYQAKKEEEDQIN
jgi:hypothetical protein